MGVSKKKTPRYLWQGLFYGRHGERDLVSMLLTKIQYGVGGDSNKRVEDAKSFFSSPPNWMNCLPTFPSQGGGEEIKQAERSTDNPHPHHGLAMASTTRQPVRSFPSLAFLASISLANVSRKNDGAYRSAPFSTITSATIPHMSWRNLASTCASAAMRRSF